MREVAPGRTLVDVGGMWGINGAHSFLAEDSGAAAVTLVDTYVTEEFRRYHSERGSSVRVVVGDITDEATVGEIGRVDVVWCFGVLYHHPSPFGLLHRLRSLTGQKLVLETLTIPEIHGVPHGAVFFPFQHTGDSRTWDTSHSGAAMQFGINRPFDDAESYANNFWGMAPSCIIALLRSTGFQVTSWGPSPSGVMRHVFVAEPVPVHWPKFEEAAPAEPGD